MIAIGGSWRLGWSSGLQPQMSVHFHRRRSHRREPQRRGEPAGTGFINVSNAKSLTIGGSMMMPRPTAIPTPWHTVLALMRGPSVH